MAATRIFRFLALVLTLLAPMTLGAAPAANAGEPKVYIGSIPGVAINGYDPVAYFTENRPVEGSEAITTAWNGATWRFASEENRSAFVANPEKYAPQYGGYCAYAVSYGSTASTDPSAFTIDNGKLYLNFSKGVRSSWEKDIPGYVAKADANWPKVLE